MGRRGGRAAARQEQELVAQREHCRECGHFMRVAYTYRRTVVRLDGLWRLTLHVRTCGQRACSQYHRAYVPEELGAWVLPQGEFGLDVIALIGQLRTREQRSVPQIHQALRERG